VVNDRTIPNDFQPSTPKIQKKRLQMQGKCDGNLYDVMQYIQKNTTVKPKLTKGQTMI
jgi:hypothetical protein